MSNLLTAWKRLYPHMTDNDWSVRSLTGLANRLGAAKIILSNGKHIEPFTDDMRQMLQDLRIIP